MKTRRSEKENRADDDLRAEYDFSGGVRGKHYKLMQAGYTITIRREDGTAVVKEVRPREGMVFLEPDVREYFPDAESVNKTLRSLITLVPAKRVRGKAQGKPPAKPKTPGKAR